MSNPIVFQSYLLMHRLPAATPEFKFHPERKWRFDWAWEEQRIALEVEGGVWKKGGGRHTRGSGFVRDVEKYNAAVVLGWRLLRTTPDELCTIETVENLRKLMRG